MDNVQRIYRHSEKQRIPQRPCPDCHTPIVGYWKKHQEAGAPVDPLGDVTWRCYGEQCITGKEGF